MHHNSPLFDYTVDSCQPVMRRKVSETFMENSNNDDTMHPRNRAGYSEHSMRGSSFPIDFSLSATPLRYGSADVSLVHPPPFLSASSSPFFYYSTSEQPLPSCSFSRSVSSNPAYFSYDKRQDPTADGRMLVARRLSHSDGCTDSFHSPPFPFHPQTDGHPSSPPSVHASNDCHYRRDSGIPTLTDYVQAGGTVRRDVSGVGDGDNGRRGRGGYADSSSYYFYYDAHSPSSCFPRGNEPRGEPRVPPLPLNDSLYISYSSSSHSLPPLLLPPPHSSSSSTTLCDTERITSSHHQWRDDFDAGRRFQQGPVAPKNDEDEDKEESNFYLHSSVTSGEDALLGLDDILSHSTYIRNGRRSAVSLPMAGRSTLLHHPMDKRKQTVSNDGRPFNHGPSYHHDDNEDHDEDTGRGGGCRSTSRPWGSTSCSVSNRSMSRLPSYRSHSSVAASRAHRLLGSACRAASFPPPPSSSLRLSSAAAPTTMMGRSIGTSSFNGSSEMESCTREMRSARVERGEEKEEGGRVGSCSSSSLPPPRQPSSSVCSSFVPDYRYQSYCVASVLHSGARSREVGVALCHFPSMFFTLAQFSDGMSYNKLLSFLSSKDPVEVVVPLSSSFSASTSSTSSVTSSSHFLSTLLQHLSEDTTCTGLPRSLFHSERGVELIMELQSNVSWSSHLSMDEHEESPFFCASSVESGGGGSAVGRGGGPEATGGEKVQQKDFTPSSHGTGMRLTSQFLEQEASDRYLCVAAAHALIRYLESLHDCRWRPHSLCIRYEELEQYMEISRASARALHLIPPSYSSMPSLFFVSQGKQQPSSPYPSQFSYTGTNHHHGGDHHHPRGSSTVLTLIDIFPRTCTMMGQRFLRSAILQPLRGKKAIECRLDVVEWFLQQPQRLLGLRQCLQGGGGGGAGARGGGGGLAHIDLERLCAELLVCSPFEEEVGEDGRWRSPSGSCTRDSSAESELNPHNNKGDGSGMPSSSSSRPTSFSQDFVLSTLDYHLSKIQQLHDYWDTLKGCEKFYRLLGHFLGLLDEEHNDKGGDGRMGSTSTDHPSYTHDEKEREEKNILPYPQASRSSMMPNTSSAEKPLLLYHIFYTLQACRISSLLALLRQYLDESILLSHLTPATNYSSSSSGWDRGGRPKRRGGRGVVFRGRSRGRYGASYYDHIRSSTSTGKWSIPQRPGGLLWSSRSSTAAVSGEKGSVSRAGRPPSSSSQEGMKSNIFRMLRLSFMVRATPAATSTATSFMEGRGLSGSSPHTVSSLSLPIYRQQLSRILGSISSYTDSLQREYGLTTLRLEPDIPCSNWRRSAYRRHAGGGSKENKSTTASYNNIKKMKSTQRLYRLSFCASELNKVRAISFSFMYGVGRSHVTAALEMWQQTQASSSPRAISSDTSLSPSSSSFSTSSSSSSSFSSPADEVEEYEGDDIAKQRGTKDYYGHARRERSSLAASSCYSSSQRKGNASRFSGTTSTCKSNPNVRIRCSTSELDALCEEAQECLAYVVAEEMRVAGPLFQSLQHHLGRLQAIGESIALLDTLMSFALYSATQQGQRPILLDPPSTCSSESSGSDNPTTLPLVTFYESRYPSMTLGSPYSLFQDIEMDHEGKVDEDRNMNNDTEQCEEGERRGKTEIKGLRQAYPSRAGDGAYVPNTITWEKGVPLLIVTGPNMSGKTTLLRQVGQLQVLAQCGCFLPVGKPYGRRPSTQQDGKPPPASTTAPVCSVPRGHADEEKGEGGKNCRSIAVEEHGEVRRIKGEKEDRPFPPPLSSGSGGSQDEILLTGRTQVSLVHRLMAHLLCDDLPSATLSTFKKELLLLTEMTEAIAIDCSLSVEKGEKQKDRSESCTTCSITNRNSNEVNEKWKDNKGDGGGKGGSVEKVGERPSYSSSTCRNTTSSCSSSLILIDELGRSTNTREGFALAWAFGRFVCELPHSVSLSRLSNPTPVNTPTGRADHPSGDGGSSHLEGRAYVSPPPIRVLLTTHFEGLPGLRHLYPHAVRHHHFAFTTTTTSTSSSGDTINYSHHNTSVCQGQNTTPTASTSGPGPDGHRRRTSAPPRTLFTTSHRLLSGPCPSSRGIHYGLALAKRLQLLPEVVDGAYQLLAMEEEAAAAAIAEEEKA